jgi:hypothetical protein
MANSHSDLRPTRLRARRALPPGWLVAAVALAPLLLASCGTENASDHPPVGVGAAVTEAQAAGDPCAGKPEKYIVAWFTQGGVKYPLRCGKTGRGGYGYLHITRDPADDGTIGHGDPINDPSFATEITPADLAKAVDERRQQPVHHPSPVAIAQIDATRWHASASDSSGATLTRRHTSPSTRV